MASIISRSFRLQRNITTINVTTLQKAKYVIKTQLRMSQGSYTHTPECPLYGISQGAGNSLAVWALLSSTMFSLYSSHAHRAHFYDPSKLITPKLTWWALSMVPVAASTCFFPPNYMNLNTTSTLQYMILNYGTAYRASLEEPCKQPNACTICCILTSPP